MSSVKLPIGVNEMTFGLVILVQGMTTLGLQLASSKTNRIGDTKDNIWCSNPMLDR
jgi:hypothetical protein